MLEAHIHEQHSATHDAATRALLRDRHNISICNITPFIPEYNYHENSVDILFESLVPFDIFSHSLILKVRGGGTHIFPLWKRLTFKRLISTKSGFRNLNSSYKQLPKPATSVSPPMIFPVFLLFSSIFPHFFFAINLAEPSPTNAKPWKSVHAFWSYSVGKENPTYFDIIDNK
uniref:SFRICE_016284 n=1 Tax=Spodoptera frugiperda TaxID=7108 RepID=A0A2H1VI93_SPOFR